MFLIHGLMQIETLLQDKDTLITEVIRLRKQQDATQRMLAATLNELHETRCEQQRTQDTVEKVVSFLSNVVDGQRSKNDSVTQCYHSDYDVSLHSSHSVR